MDGKKFFLFLGIGLVTYLLTAGITFFALSAKSTADNKTKSPLSENKTAQKGRLKRDPNAPLTEECPLNGDKATKDERTAWEKRRPLGIMVENSKAARPQSGLSFADVVYEAVAEGGITRFMGVFYCQDSDIVGPVRSARTYYLDWISEYGSFPLYSHVGGANTPGPANALGQIARYGWEGYNDLSQFNISFPVYWQDKERLGPDTPVEHSYYSSTKKLWDFAATKRQLTNMETDEQTGKQVSWDENFTKWTFKDDVAFADRPKESFAEFNPSGIQASYIGDYVVRWQYNQNENSYYRSNGGVAHKDLDTNEQLKFKNIVLLYTTLTVADDGYDEPGHGSHNLYGTIGSGKAKFLIDGKIVDGVWKKASRTARTIFTDNAGKPISFNRGQIWIEVLPIGTQLKTE